MEMLKDLLKKKKKDSEIDPVHKDAKMSVLKQIRDMAAKDMGDGIKGMKKVEVAAPDTKGLKTGLDTAKALLADKDKDEEDQHESSDDESPEEEASESPEEEAKEESEEHDDEEKPSAEKMIEDEIDHEASEGDLSSDEIDELIAVLQAKKAKLSK